MRKRRVLLVGLGLFLAAMLAPIGWIETSCIEKPRVDESGYRPILAPAHHRPETNTYVTYPEWLIVHVYEDYAAVAKSHGESAFPYGSSMVRYWSNLCVMTQHASAHGEITGDSKAMLYTIGVSFSVEMAIKGAYEKTIGWLTEAIAGNKPTPEDAFARAMADDYAVFLVQTPWYAYPFGKKLSGFWADVTWSDGNFVRKLERRLAFSLEFGAKALYAKAIEAAAGITPAPLQIRSVVRGGDPAGLQVSGVKVVETLANGATVIETPRYREFTHIVRGLSRQGIEFAEIAGNDDIFITALVPAQAPKLEGQLLITAAVAARPGWHRQGLVAKVADLASLAKRLESLGGELEHVYEY
jgi:hypothetical protein